MGHEEDLEGYRSQLLESLNSRPTIRGVSDPIQVYVNERRVGELEGAGIGATLHVQCVDHIETVQLRAEDGTLLGGLTAPECGYRTDRIRLSADTVELSVHNMAQGGTLSALFTPAPSIWSRAWKGIADMADRLVARRPEPAFAYGMRTVAFTQALVAVAVVGLVADRITIRGTSEPTPSSIVQSAILSSAPVVDMAKLEQQLDELARMQTKVDDALGSQQKGMAQLQQAMLKLSSTQESFESNAQTVREEIEKRLETVGREADRQARQMASRGRIEQEQLEAAIQSLTADNARLSKEVVSLEEHNQVLRTKFQTAVANASKAVDSSSERLLKMADNLQATQQTPFLFWVTFSDGTSQESIDKWVHEMKGHKGAISEGWQEVRILPPAVPPDRFLEQVRGEKIVKAARISQ
ncbi:hypothetical protein [Candidatus Nitrospira nitrificans]|uniref:Uncharacterized protein n=1 Tax=Candidatus Nitrospira nitrificans TaxID=1742973 RepID=A0A0S4LBV0_9BACT|nr:hypothetical protein [Candidatus Nitrospira nitrificans]CUS35228.1 hypothetical protein COMA2_20156 [Candidatus Nitrospira nitrificans]